MFEGSEEMWKMHRSTLIHIQLKQIFLKISMSRLKLNGSKLTIDVDSVIHHEYSKWIWLEFWNAY